jgi:hypothetical protein
MDPLRITTETLEPTIAHIADTVTKLHARDQRQQQQQQQQQQQRQPRSRQPTSHGPQPRSYPAAAAAARIYTDNNDDNDDHTNVVSEQRRGEQDQGIVNGAETPNGANEAANEAAGAEGASPAADASSSSGGGGDGGVETADSDSASLAVQQLHEKQQQRQQQRQTVRRALDTPRRIRALMRAGRRDSALREWHAVARVLDGEWRGVEGVDALRDECERALKEET